MYLDTFKELTISSITDKIKLFEKTSTGCPVDWTRYIGTDNKCIKAFKYRKYYTDALEYCQIFKNGTLVSIHNGFQNGQVGTHCFELTYGTYWKDPCWIGVNNFENLNEYLWIDGSSFDYSYWYNSISYTEPSGGIILVSNNYQWDDFQSDSYYFVCVQDLWNLVVITLFLLFRCTCSF